MSVIHDCNHAIPLRIPDRIHRLSPMYDCHPTGTDVLSCGFLACMDVPVKPSGRHPCFQYVMISRVQISPGPPLLLKPGTERFKLFLADFCIGEKFELKRRPHSRPKRYDYIVIVFIIMPVGVIVLTWLIPEEYRGSCGLLTRPQSSQTINIPTFLPFSVT